jgi:Ti-type conjugative transfer relaxase TraA
MILEGNARGFGAELAVHLLNPRDNDHVTVHAVDGFVADDLHGAFAEIEAISQATQCQKYLFSLSLNPPMDQSVSVELFEATIAETERRLGLVGQPRAIVFHEKNGRRHAHCVWSRINVAEMKAVPLPHSKRKLTKQAHEIFLAQGWDVPKGFERFAERDPLNCSRQEAQQAKRTGHDRAALKRMFVECWVGSDNAAAFSVGLKANGFVLARGDRRGFVAVDADGKVWSLSRWCGVKTRELSRRLGSLDDVPDVEQATLLAQGIEPATKPTPDPQREIRRKDLVAKQRSEREELLKAQEVRRIEALKARPKGLRRAFLRVTGRYQSFVAQCEADAKRAQNAAALERQAMIDRHLTERRALDHDLGLSKTLRKASRPEFTPKPDQDALSKSQVLNDPTRVLERISYHKASFGRADVMRALADHIPDHRQLAKTTDDVLRTPKVMRLPGDGVKRFTTQDYQNAEQKMLASAQNLANASDVGVSQDNRNAAIDSQDKEMKRTFGGKLSEEQRAAITQVLGKEQLSQVVGLAGAGKSTMLATAADAWRRQGINVHGAALAGKAAEGLQDCSGIKSRTLAALELSWQNGHEPITRGDVLVIDEAGMIGTRQMSRIMSKCQEIGAKLVLVGDPEQLQPIEAGTPFRDLVDIHGAAKLTEIHRQKADWQKQAARDLADGNTAKAVDCYKDRGAVTQSVNADDAIDALAERYAMDALSDPDRSRLAFAHRRKDVHALNQGIRNALRGEDTESDVMLTTDTGKRAFAAGDRLVFCKNDKELGVKNGMLGTVEQVREGKLKVALDGETERSVSFDPRSYQSFDHGYAVTIHKSQGATVDAAYVLASRSMDQHLAYVAMTRHREDLQIYASHDDAPKWTRSLDRDRHHAPTRAGPSMG